MNTLDASSSSSSSPTMQDHLQVSPTGYYMYRRRVPSDLVEVLDKREVKLALKTQDPLMACLVARVVNAEVERTFEQVRDIMRQRDGIGSDKDHPIDAIAQEAKELTDDALKRLSIKSGDENEGDE